MTTTTPVTPVTATTADADARDGGRRLRRLGAGALIASPVLVLGGMMTCPPQDSDSAADYITSLARTPWLSEASAMFLHYGMIAGGLGLLAVPGLIRGRRGRLVTLLGAVFAALGLLNLSGAVRDDWWRMVAGRQLPLDVAVKVSDAVDASALMPLWKGTEVLAFLGLLLVSIGLARGGVVGWWLTVVFVAAFVGMMFVPIQLTYVAGAVFTVLYLPLAVAGVRILQRERLAGLA